MGPMDVDVAVERIRSSLLHGLVTELRAGFAVGRCTLRLARQDALFPVAFEARAAEVASLIGDTSVDLRGQPVVEALRSGAGQVVQEDCRSASGDPAFQRMLVAYGGLGAQIVTAVEVEGELAGILSLHHLGGSRVWNESETALAARGAALAGALAAFAGPIAPPAERGARQ